MEKQFKKNVKIDTDYISERIENCINIFDKEEAVKRIVEYIKNTVDNTYQDCETQFAILKFTEIIYNKE